MFSSEIEAFRIRKGMTVEQFCTLTRVRISQYRAYINSSKTYLSVMDAVRLLAAFPDEMGINSLLFMTEHKPLRLREGFPRFCFSINEEYDRNGSAKAFRKFYVKTVHDLFSAEEAVMLLNAMSMPWNRTDIGLPFSENMYSLMDCLRIIRQIRFTGFSIPPQTVLTHFQRKRLITRFSNLCEYERAFGSGGIYLLSELMYLNVRKGFGIRLWE